MKTLLIRALCCATIAFTTVTALAADPYPSKPIRIIVYVGGGTLVDVTARAVAEKMAEHLRQPVVVENMPGAAGLLGIRKVKTSPADGYTLLAATNTVAQAPVLVAEPGYELKDFTAIGGMNQGAFVMVGPPDQAAKTVAELIASAKANPDKLTFASGGVGTSTYLAGSMFLHQAGIKMLHVPYKGTSAAMPDVIGGRVNMMFDAENTTTSHIQEGRLRGFAISSTTRSKALPDVPTMAELGLPNYAFTFYNGLMVRADTPKEIVQRLSEALAFALKSDAVRDRFRRDGSQAFSLSPTEFNEFVRQDSQRIGKMAADMGMQKQ